MHDRSEILVVEDSAQSAIVRVRGELDFLTADELEAAMNRAQHGSGRFYGMPLYRLVSSQRPDPRGQKPWFRSAHRRRS
jgi:hypothetical protein